MFHPQPKYKAKICPQVTSENLGFRDSAPIMPQKKFKIIIFLDVHLVWHFYGFPLHKNSPPFSFSSKLFRSCKPFDLSENFFRLGKALQLHVYDVETKIKYKITYHVSLHVYHPIRYLTPMAKSRDIDAVT